MCNNNSGTLKRPFTDDILIQVLSYFLPERALIYSVKLCKAYLDHVKQHEASSNPVVKVVISNSVSDLQEESNVECVGYNQVNNDGNNYT
jgi:hypothetical protein